MVQYSVPGRSMHWVKFLPPRAPHHWLTLIQTLQRVAATTDNTLHSENGSLLFCCRPYKPHHASIHHSAGDAIIQVFTLTTEHSPVSRPGQLATFIPSRKLRELSCKATHSSIHLHCMIWLPRGRKVDLYLVKAPDAGERAPPTWEELVSDSEMRHLWCFQVIGCCFTKR